MDIYIWIYIYMAPLKPNLLDYLKDWRARSGDLSLLWLACAREKSGAVQQDSVPNFRSPKRGSATLLMFRHSLADTCVKRP